MGFRRPPSLPLRAFLFVHGQAGSQQTLDLLVARMQAEDNHPCEGRSVMTNCVTAPIGNVLCREACAEQADLAGPVAAEKERTAWYAGAEFVRLPRAGASVSAARLHRQGARFLIVDGERLSQREWLRTPDATGFRELRRLEAEGRTAHVYEIYGPQP